MWFGSNSFQIAHHIIAKTSSGVALFVIAYMVMCILPEILELIDGLWGMTAEQMHNLREKVAEILNVCKRFNKTKLIQLCGLTFY